MTQENPSNGGQELVIVSSLCLVLTTVATALRVYVRGFLIKNFGLDDWAALIGWISFVLWVMSCLVAVAYGAGQHDRFIQPQSHVSIGMMWIWILERFYTLCIMAVKLSIGLMLLRFLQEGRLRTAVWILLCAFELCSALIAIMCIFICIPVPFYWTRYRGATHGNCLPTPLLVIGNYFYSAFNCIVDWTFAIIPWFILRNLQLNKRTKILTSLVLSLGALASIATIARLPYVGAIGVTDDFLYANVNSMVWSLLEVALGIIAGAAATFKPLLNKFLLLSRRDSMRRGTLQQPGSHPKPQPSIPQSTEFFANLALSEEHTGDEELRDELSAISTSSRDHDPHQCIL